MRAVPRHGWAALALLFPAAWAACSSNGPSPVEPTGNDSGVITASAGDSGPDVGTGSADSGAPDATKPDASPSSPDGGTEDSSLPSTLGLDPAMGWSSWSFIRNNPTEASIHAQAQALHDSNLSQHGYVFINIDDFYYENPSQTVDAYGRWMVDPTKFPGGMAAMGTFVHNLGLKFGMYMTPGIPAAAVTQNTPIEGTSYHASDIVLDTNDAGTPQYQSENNYNYGANVMLYINYTKPGAQDFIDSWANLLASYGVDYLKLDGVGTWDVPDVQAWSQALEQSGRTIHFELSNSLAQSMGSTWATLANGWRIDGDIECYCSSSSYPLTDWSNVSGRFSDVLGWQAFSHAGARNDLDSLELGNGDNDGLTIVERQTQMSLWALSAAPLLLGTDLTSLELGDLALLTNDEVIAIDHAGVPAQRVAGGDTQVWFAPQPDGSVAVGLFNLGGSSSSVTANWSDLGLTGAAAVRDVWARANIGSFTGSFQTTLDSHAVALLRISQ